MQSYTYAMSSISNLYPRYCSDSASWACSPVVGAIVRIVYGLENADTLRMAYKVGKRRRTTSVRRLGGALGEMGF